MKQSIKQLLHEYDKVMNTRERLEKIFGMITDCHVTVGGSYALKYLCEIFAEREVSDYDFILYADEKGATKIKSFVSLMNVSMPVMSEAYMYTGHLSFYWGYLNGKKINIILKTDKYCPCANFESLDEIIDIKRKWCEEAIKNGKAPRVKDEEDIMKYDEWSSLPF